MPHLSYGSLWNKNLVCFDWLSLSTNLLFNINQRMEDKASQILTKQKLCSSQLLRWEYDFFYTIQHGLYSTSMFMITLAGCQWQMFCGHCNSKPLRSTNSLQSRKPLWFRSQLLAVLSAAILAGMLEDGIPVLLEVYRFTIISFLPQWLLNSVIGTCGTVSKGWKHMYTTPIPWFTWLVFF